MEDLVRKASDFAKRKHKHQFRDDGETPYIEDPKAVMQIVRDEFHLDDPEVLAAALLHDTIEDTNTDFDEIADEFGRRVAKMVAVLTKDKRMPKGPRERKYFAGLSKAPNEVKICKVADTLHNLRDTINEERKEKAKKNAKKLLKTINPSGRLKGPLSILKKELSR